MAKIVISILICFFSLFSFSQEKNTENTIFITCDLKVYRQIAVDSIKKIYNMQLQSGIKDGISSLYKFEDLSLKSLPKYKIKKSAFLFYSCSEKIENFVEFNDSLKYQTVIVLSGDRELTNMNIPNVSTEMEKMFNLNQGSIIDKSTYSSEVLHRFKVMPYSEDANKYMQERPYNFFFGIYGLWGVFEVEKESGIVYANIAHYEYKKVIHKRMLINDFIRDYIGEEMIKALSIGYYEDYNGTGELEGKACEKASFNKKNVILNVNVLD